ncbi:MAG: C_GCAxxG_C_C family protein [Ignavibacteriae bacterium]|nr:C_GCAxxG_C_C family protein [Ignavibacteriota bacterium]MCB9211342.1 C_GCAxxG_C_C family protein [Ignavibacteriales bacterium]MCB9218734.1 C_GCAxxG_C_C family protein [Ignavibacteriales bacterium]MCB9259260.1 C_GCAxxG_C_C family protein [Ignavibacteriales bacterium]
MKNHLEIALSQFDNGFNCAQSVLYSFCEDLNLDNDLALKMSCGFGGGIGRKGEICGALTGGIIAIGTKYGNDTNGENENAEFTYSATRELIDNFTKKHGTHECRKLIHDCDLLTEEGQNKFKVLDLKNKVCKQCIASVVEYLEETL